MKLSIWWTIGIAAVTGAVAWFVSSKFTRSNYAKKVVNASNGAAAAEILKNG